MMHKDIEGTKTCYILIAENERGETVVCESYGEESAARGAFSILSAPVVCLLKQVCTTDILGHKTMI